MTHTVLQNIAHDRIARKAEVIAAPAALQYHQNLSRYKFMTRLDDVVHFGF